MDIFKSKNSIYDKHPFPKYKIPSAKQRTHAMVAASHSWRNCARGCAVPIKLGIIIPFGFPW
jgi:hypothetical protein